MKVLVISHSCVVDVNQQVFVALSAREGVEVALLLPSHWKSEYNGEAMSPRFLPEVDFPVFTAPVYAPGHITFHCYRHLPLRKIRDFGPDVILSTQEPWSLSNLQAMWLASRLKVPFAFQTNQNIYKNYPPPFSWLEQMAYRRAGIALAYSEEARQVMLKKGLMAPSEVVPYATDTRRFSPHDSHALRERLGLAGAEVIGYMGRLVPEKGLDTLIDAVASVRAERKSATPLKLLLVGAGSQEAELRQRVAERGLTEDTIFTGLVPHNETAAYMACMDIFVLPSRTMPNWKEQFGRVIIEALASHVPVIGSDSGQIPHLINETGGGLVFNEGDAGQLANCLHRLLSFPAERRRLAERGARVVVERFTCEAVAAQLHYLLRGLIGPASAPASLSKTATEQEA